MANQQPPSERDLLYTDCYISRMLGTREAALYFTRLLRFDERHLQLAFSQVLGIIFIIHPALPVQLAPPSTSIANRPAWLLDYISRNYGTVVPQRIWTPAAPGDVQRYRNVSNMPIFFVHSDRRTLGLRLVQAASGNCAGLMNGHAPSPIGGRHTTYIRIRWPGYDEQSSQIMTRDQTSAQNTISLETLAARIARAVCRFLELLPNQPCQCPSWRVGDRGGITPNDVILIGLIQVSQGSWQPILQLSRYIISP